MPSSYERSRYESRLAAASKAIWQAADLADVMADEGAAEDLYGMREHLQKLMEDSLRGRKQKRVQIDGQQAIPF